MVWRKQIQLVSMSIQCCCELWCRSQTWLRFHVTVAVVVAVAVVGSCSSDLTPSLGTSIFHGCDPKKKKAKTKQTNLKTPRETRGKMNVLL